MSHVKMRMDNKMQKKDINFLHEITHKYFNHLTR